MPETIYEKFQRFFVAVIPPDPVFTEIEKFKHYIFNKYGSRASFRSPAHITIYRPFVWKKEKKERLIRAFSDFNFHPFDCRLNGFGFFPKNKVVYVRPECNNDLTMLYENFSDFFSQKLNLVIEKKHHRPFHPHITIAFRDVNQNIYNDLFNEFSRQFFERTFRIEGLYLLKWHENRWDRYSYVNFTNVE